MSELNTFLKYCNSSNEEKFDFICRNYTWIEVEISNSIENLVNLIIEEQRYSYVNSLGELGTRVQTSRTVGSPTEAKAIQKNITEHIIYGDEIDEDELEGVENIKEILFVIARISQVKNDYKLFVRNLDMLNDTDKKIISTYLVGKDSINYLMKYLCISEAGVRKRIYRIKEKLKTKMCPYMSKTMK